MKNYSIAIALGLSEYQALTKRVGEKHGWCDITPLSGDYEENIFMATFADDYRLLFEVNKELIMLLLTCEQDAQWAECTEEENIATLEEVLVFYLRWREENT